MEAWGGLRGKKGEGGRGEGKGRRERERERERRKKKEERRKKKEERREGKKKRRRRKEKEGRNILTNGEAGSPPPREARGGRPSQRGPKGKVEMCCACGMET